MYKKTTDKIIYTYYEVTALCKKEFKKISMKFHKQNFEGNANHSIINTNQFLNRNII